MLQQQQRPAPAPAGTTDRSNSLQRMLDLEKQYMFQRLQQANDTSPRRPPLTSHNSNGSNTNKSPRRGSFAAQPPLVIHASPRLELEPESSIADQYTSLVAMIDDDMPSPSLQTPTAADKPSPKVVAFQFPPDFADDRRSLCQSPSWEAYDRRKREKRDEKEEKRREEERKREDRRREDRRRKDEEERLKASKKPPQAKPRRLSKPPPVAATTPASDAAKAAAPATRQPRSQKPRPNSALDLVLPAADDAPDPNRPRKRSGSFASLIRAPFEHRRRASLDQQGERPGFVGGIKLEQERFEAEQRANESNIHPALRKGRPEDESSSSSPQPSPRTPTAGRRAYPPITILTASSNSRALAAQDASRMDRLRLRVGLKPAGRTASADGRLDPSSRPDAQPVSGGGSNTSLPTLGSSAESARAKSMEKLRAQSVERGAQPKSPGLTPEPLRLKTDTAGGARRNINEKQLNIRIPHKDDEGRPSLSSTKASPLTPKDGAHSKPKDSDPTLADLVAREGQTTATLLPLRPPRKSSKRSLGTNSSASSPSTATPRLHSATSESAGTDSTHDFLGTFSSPYSPPSLELNAKGLPPARHESRFTEDFHDTSARPSDRRPKDAAKSAQEKSNDEPPKTERRSRRPPLISSDERSRNTSVFNRPLSSASGTSSEELQYHSPMSTPGTSYPQSEKELTDTELAPISSDRRKTPQPQSKPPFLPEDLPPPAYSRHHRRKPSARSDIEEDIDLERIQAAARKVMAAFPPASPPRSAPDRRTQSDPDVAATVGLASKLKRKDKSKLGQVTGSEDLSKSEAKGATRAPLLGGQVKAKSAANLPHAARAQIVPPSPTSLPRFSLDALSKAPTQAPPLPRHSTDSGREPVAKMFVECCSCRYYHDLPSRLYEAMARPDAALAAGDPMAAQLGAAPMTVRCPWCRHDMSTRCCAGLAAMVYVKERLH
jgi:hypothetical protein